MGQRTVVPTAACQGKSFRFKQVLGTSGVWMSDFLRRVFRLKQVLCRFAVVVLGFVPATAQRVGDAVMEVLNAE